MMLRHLFGANATAETMIDAIARDAQETGALTGRPVFADAVMEAMRTVPREAFVPEGEKAFAWENRPLPIGHGQTISQPYIVALMSELLDVEPDARILEVGTGCGYQTAVLCALGAVPSIRSRWSSRWRARQRCASRTWATPGPRCALATAAAAGPSTRPTMASSSRQPRPRCRRRWWLSSSPAPACSSPSGARLRPRACSASAKRHDGSCETTTVLPVAFVPLTGGQV